MGAKANFKTMIKSFYDRIPKIWISNFKYIITKSQKPVLPNKKKAYIFLAADYGNLGDIALTFALILIFFKFILTIKPNSSVILVSLLSLDIIVIAFYSSIYIKLIVFLSSIILGHKHKINRNTGDITVSLFNKYYKKTIYPSKII